MATCCQVVGPPVSLPYYPGGRCDLDAPLAEDSPWTVYDNETDRNPVGPAGAGTYAEKVVGTVVITLEVADGNPGSNAVVRQPDPAGYNEFNGGAWGFPQGARILNGVNVFQAPQSSTGGNSVAAMRFTVSVPQPRIQARIVDLDARAGGAGETVRVNGQLGSLDPFGDLANMGEADTVIPFKAGPFGNENSVVQFVNGGATGGGYKGHPTQNESSAVLMWEDRPWGDGVSAPDMVIAWVLSPNGNGGASMYDFGGPIQQEVCTFDPRYAARIFCCETGETTLQDTVDGHTLTPAEAATVERRRS